MRRFIEKDAGHCFPLGTANTFTTYFAPADFNETVNTLGQPLYAKQEPRRFDRGTDLHTQSKSFTNVPSSRHISQACYSIEERMNSIKPSYQYSHFS